MFVKKDIYELQQNVFEEINHNWMLVSAKNPEGKVNTMTASWGAMGEIWNKEAITIYIRQTRYTKEFIDSQDYFTVSLFDGYKKELGILGSMSGREGDKIAEAGMTLAEVDGQPTFEQSKCVFVCKKMYEADIPLESMSEEIQKRWYDGDSIHTMYIGEIVGCYVQE